MLGTGLRRGEALALSECERSQTPVVRMFAEAHTALASIKVRRRL
jgi:hypothetical protein